jgi:hypothetical protein
VRNRFPAALSVAGKPETDHINAFVIIACVRNLDFGYSIGYGAAWLTKQSLTPDDWIKAAFRLLTMPDPRRYGWIIMCKALGVTKGSFYWHFADLGALKAAMIERWRLASARDLIASATPELSPRDLIIGFIEDILHETTRRRAAR